VSKLPPPTTFSEGMRFIFSIAAIAFAVCCGLGLVGLCGVLIWGNWPKEFYGQILTILGAIAIGALILLGITQVGQLVGGPVGRFKGGVSKTGLDFEASGSDAPIAPSTIAAAAQGAAAGAVSAASTAPTSDPLPKP
jgi:hypothetical protein